MTVSRNAPNFANAISREFEAHIIREEQKSSFADNSFASNSIAQSKLPIENPNIKFTKYPLNRRYIKR